MITDIGGGTTEIAVLSLADIVSSKSLRVAGDKLDEAIINHMKRVHNLHIGEQTAERIKINIGSAYPLEEEKTLEVKVQDATSGLPRGCVVSSQEIRDALKDPVTQICRAIREVLEKTPPELSADLVDSGLTLCGGGALLRGIDKLIEESVGLPVKKADDPLACVALGTGIFLEHLDRYSSILESSHDME
jgi:rod shape-determining protein MreB